MMSVSIGGFWRLTCKADPSSHSSPVTIREYSRFRQKDLQPFMDVRICDITQDLVQEGTTALSKNNSSPDNSKFLIYNL